jgi:hypothetical protein
MWKKDMGTRGRRSIAELMVVNGGATPANRPDPPRDLDAAEAVEWREIVASMPAAYFARPPHYPLMILLTLLCRHIVAARFIDRLIADCRKKNKLDREHAMLLRTQSEESAMIMRLQRAMRLTHQTVYRADSPKLRPVSTRPPPWIRQ